MKKYSFKTGDRIPQFIERYSEEHLQGTFGVDVEVFVEDSGVCVYPLEEVKDSYSVINFKTIKEFSESEPYETRVISGMPTRVFTKPYGYLDNSGLITT